MTTRPVSDGAVKRFALPVIATVFVSAAFLYDPTPPSLCFSKRVAGFACPGCGLVRSVTALADGDVAAALEFHLFGPVVLAAGLAVWGLSIRGLFRKQTYTIPDSTPMNASLGLAFVLFLLYWAARAGTGGTP